jgi:hypothetical protein
MLKDIPRAGSVAESPLALLVDQRRNVAEPCTRLNRRNLGLVVERDIVHAVELHDKMAVLAAKAEGRIAVPARLRVHLDAHLGSTQDGSLDLLDGGGGGNCSGEVRKPLVEGVDVELPIFGIRRVNRDPGGREAVVKSGSLALGMRGGSGQDGCRGREGECEPHCGDVPAE